MSVLAVDRRSVLVFLAMMVASVLAYAMVPREKIAGQGPKVDLEAMIPKEFGEWRVDRDTLQLVANPEAQSLLNKIYNQTLSRTYINERGTRIMLSIAYGGDQRDSMQVHKPEVCYPAQGFQISNLATGMFDTGFGIIPVKRLLATHGTRAEPIIYWITVGDTVAINGFNWKLGQLKYGLTGKVPDGMIFRVSSIGDELSVYPVQVEFIRVLLKALTAQDRKRLIGTPTL